MSDIRLPGFRRSLRKGIRVLCLPMLLCGPLGAAQADPDLSLEPDRLLPPPLQFKGEANPDYARDLEARLSGLPAADRKAFFKHLRRQQRALARHLEQMEFNYEKTKALHTSLAGEEPGLIARAEALVTAQRLAIRQYRGMAGAIDQLRRQEDPSKVDASDFQADLYAGFEFDTLYQDQNRDSSFFSKSLPFVALDLRTCFSWPGREQWLEPFGTLSFQSASKETSDTVAVITSTGAFKGTLGLWWMRPVTETVSWGVLGSTGAVGYTTQETAPDLTVTNRDEFRATGANGDFYLEGWCSKGRTGRDEAVLTLGVRLSTLSFFRSLGGGRL